MIRINLTNLNNLTFQASKQEEKTTVVNEKQKNKKLFSSLTGLATLGIVALVCGKKSKMTYEQALEKNGVQIKNGIAILSKTGEKYTGSIKRNVKAYGLKKETVQFEQGIITEKVYHNNNGKELEGEFYKNGIKRISVSNGDLYSIVQYDANGKLEILGEARNTNQNKFTNARDIIRKLKD